jgi:hypothetical protein
MVMEKAGGVPLFQRWDKMTQLSKLELIRGLTKLENQLASIRFPAYGSLYLRDSCPDLDRYHALDAAEVSSGSYCVGPSCERAYMLQAINGTIENNVDKGPCKNLKSYDCGVFLNLRSGSSISAFGKAVASKQMLQASKSRCKQANESDLPRGANPAGNILPWNQR